MYIKIEAITDAPENRLEKIAPDHFRVWVTEPPEQNRANRKILTLVRRECGAERTIIKIVSGHHSPHKIISVEQATE